MLKTERVLIWPWPARVLHWSLVASVALAWWTRESLGPWHEWFGYAVLAIACLRLWLGWRSPHRHLRFGQFVRAPAATWRYARQFLAGHAARHLGHNPLGGWMIVALLCNVLALTFTGWLYTTDAFWGAGWLAHLHAYLGYGLLCLVALHVTGVVYTGWRHRENLVWAMLTGHKRAPQDDDVV